MARKIYDITERRYLKNTVAKLLIRRLIADWEKYGYSIRRRSASTRTLTAAQVQPVRQAFVPAKLPPIEVGGCRFQEPQGDTWQRQHRGELQSLRIVRLSPQERVY